MTSHERRPVIDVPVEASSKGLAECLCQDVAARPRLGDAGHATLDPRASLFGVGDEGFTVARHEHPEACGISGVHARVEVQAVSPVGSDRFQADAA